MKRLIIAAALAVAGCTTLPTAPSYVAEQTVLDERGAIAVELAYKAARMAVEAATDAGAIRGETAARFAELDNQAYGAVRAARSAYRAGNAASYEAALTEARGAVAQLLALAA